MRQQKSLSPPVLDPRAVYTRLHATALLGLKPSTLATEIRKGRLRVSRRAGRYFILGAWLLEWIERGETSSRRRRKEVQSAPKLNTAGGVSNAATGIDSVKQGGTATLGHSHKSTQCDPKHLPGRAEG
jgi:hypothetical protein